MTQTCQQNEVYQAQENCRQGGTFYSNDASLIYIDTLVNTPWWQERFPAVEQVTVSRMPGSKTWAGAASYDAALREGRIHLKDQVTELTVLHELAHICAASELGSDVGHGPVFVRVLLELVYRVQGQDAWLQDRRAFLSAGVVLD